MSSAYFKTLGKEDQDRYIEKLTFNGLPLPDPLDQDIVNLTFQSKQWPNISVFDIFSYLVLKHELYSKNAFNEYTLLPCYNYVDSEKVKNVKCYRSNAGVCVVIANVESSQTLKKMHSPWVVCTFDGEVLSAHCTCMAGLGEACSHVGTSLFYIERKQKEDREKPACTSELCTWNKTSTNIEPSPVVDINFSKPKLSGKDQPNLNTIDYLPKANDGQLKIFLQNAKAAFPSAALFGNCTDNDSEDTESYDGSDTTNDSSETTVQLPFIEQLKKIVEFVPEEGTLAEKKII